MKGPLRETIPIGPLRVRIRLPGGTEARKVRLLTAGRALDPERTADGLLVSVPSVELHEVIAIDF